MITRAIFTRNFLAQSKIDVLLWPANSPHRNRSTCGMSLDIIYVNETHHCKTTNSWQLFFRTSGLAFCGISCVIWVVPREDDCRQWQTSVWPHKMSDEIQITDERGRNNPTVCFQINISNTHYVVHGIWRNSGRWGVFNGINYRFSGVFCTRIFISI